MSSDDATTDTDPGPDSDSDDVTATEPTTIRAGRNFEREYRLDAREAGEFLVALGEQLRDGDELTLSDDGGREAWELPFAFGEPVGLEIDFDGTDEPELEIELELPGRSDESAPQVD